MTLRRTLFLGVPLGLLMVTTAYMVLIHEAESRHDGQQNFQVGFLPVTCHLTCPVTNFINESMSGDGLLKPVRFSGFPELKESFLSDKLEATFILAPMAMVLREQGVPLRIVYLGHRDGTTLMVHKDSDIRHIEDLQGKRIAIPNRYSNQMLILFKAFRDRGLDIRTAQLLDMAPPDMPAALSSRTVDAVISGEPFMAKTELEGFGRVLFLTKDVWPEFISCVLAIKDDTIAKRRSEVQRLVDGIARSGQWLDQDKDSASNDRHRFQAAKFVGQHYYNQDPQLLQFVLSKPPDRVKYTNLSVRRKDFEEIERFAKESGIFHGKVGFDDYADPSFVPDGRMIEPYQWEAPK